MKLELVKDKTKDEIADIWRQYHANKEDVVAAVIPADMFEVMSQRFQQHKTVRQQGSFTSLSKQHLATFADNP